MRNCLLHGGDSWVQIPRLGNHCHIEGEVRIDHGDGIDGGQFRAGQVAGPRPAVGLCPQRNALNPGRAQDCTGLPAVSRRPGLSRGDWLVRAGATVIDPKSDNLENVLGEPDLKLKVDDTVGLVFNVAYTLTENWAVELLAAAPCSHDVALKVAGAGSANIGETDHLPPGLSIQYYFGGLERFTPRIGVGPNWTIFSDESLRSDFLEAIELPSNTKHELDDSIGVAVQIGADIAISESWLVNIDLRWVELDTDATIKVPGPDGGRLDLGTVEIDPIVYGVSIGYRF